MSAHSAGRGLGSEFVIRLPVVQSEAPVVAPEPTQHRTLPSSSAKRVLVVDDNADAADLLRDMLHRLGHIAEVAYDGPAALRVASQFCPDVALLDIGLPIMDGYEVARRLRQQLAPSTLLVAVTGYGQEAARQRTKSVGFDYHMVKPVTVKAIAEILDHLGN